MTADTFDTDAYVGSGNVFSNSNRTVAFPNAAINNAQTLTGKSAGKWYVEVTVNSSTSGQTAVGVMPSTGSGGNSGTYNNWGEFASGAGVKWVSDGRVYCLSEILEFADWASWASGDILGIAVDCTTPLLTFYKNGALQGTVTGAQGTAQFLSHNSQLFPVVGSSVASQFTINTGQSMFSYSPPDGTYTSGWPSSGATYFGTFAANGNGQNDAVSAVNTVVVSPYVCGYDGFVSQIQIPTTGGFGGNAAGVIYDATGAGGTPGTLLASSTVLAPGSAPPGVFIFNLASGVPVSNGTTYYLGVALGSPQTGTVNYVCSPASTVSAPNAYYKAITYPTIPGTFGTPTGRHNWSIPAIASGAVNPTSIPHSFGQII